MSLAPQTPDAAPLHLEGYIPYRLSENELRLRSQFVAAFTGPPQFAREMDTAVWDVTNELKARGELAEGVVKRIKFIAALPIPLRFRAGYKDAHLRLKDSVNEAISLSIAGYFADNSAPHTRTPAGGT